MSINNVQTNLPVFAQAPRHEDVWGSVATTPFSLNLSTGWRREIGLLLWLPTPGLNNLWYSWDGILDRSRGRHGLDGKWKNCYFSPESNPNRSLLTQQSRPSCVHTRRKFDE
jgi:hypothetical protein